MDSDLSPIVAERLRQGGHDAAHVRDYGLSGAGDKEIFARAKDEDRIIVFGGYRFRDLACTEIRKAAVPDPLPAGTQQATRAAGRIAVCLRLKNPSKAGVSSCWRMRAFGSDACRLAVKNDEPDAVMA